MNDPRPTVANLTKALAAPFDPGELKFKPGVVSGNRAAGVLGSEVPATRYAAACLLESEAGFSLGLKWGAPF